jgi:hypothetical protein
MLSVGSNVRNNTEPLKKVTPEYLYNALRNPKPDFESRIRQLRVVRQLNETQYASLKQGLPYFVCASFSPAFRKTDNFAYTSYFVIDIDHIGAKGLIMADLKVRLSADPRVMMCFASPGEDGLKVMMRLKEKCYDAGVYSTFYKRFVSDFSVEYGLQQVIDGRTSDVARACFMSVDREAYFNPDAEPVDMSAVVNLIDSSELLRQKKEAEKDVEGLLSNNEQEPPPPPDPDDDAMGRIRQLLNMRPKRPAPAEKDVYVPEILNNMQEDLKEYVNELGFTVTDIVNIQYGKKIRAELGLKKAEVNLFFGKRGFSVVVSPRSGTDASLNSLLAETVQSFIDAG